MPRSVRLNDVYIFVFAVPVAFFFDSRCSKCLAKRTMPLVRRESAFPFALSFFTVIVMVPPTTCIVSVLNNGLSFNTPALAASMLKNYAFALPLQIVLLGPLVRGLFARLAR